MCVFVSTVNLANGFAFTGILEHHDSLTGEEQHILACAYFGVADTILAIFHESELLLTLSVPDISGPIRWCSSVSTHRSFDFLPLKSLCLVLKKKSVAIKTIKLN